MSLFYSGPIAVGNLMVWWSELCHIFSISSTNSFGGPRRATPFTPASVLIAGAGRASAAADAVTNANVVVHRAK